MRTAMSECEEETAITHDEETMRNQHLFRAKKLASLELAATGLSHDLNNLLAAILGNNSILLRGLPDESPWKENARQVEATALRALELNNQLLIFAGKGPLAEEMLDIAALVEDLKEPLRLSTAKGIQIKYEIPASLPCVPGDATLVRQVIKNLVTNASDAIVNREGTIHVRLRTVHCEDAVLEDSANYHGQRSGQYVCIEVEDSGCGMSDDVQERMFDPFFTTGLRGRGLGLSVVFGAAEMHAGVIQVCSSAEKGTTIRVLLPQERRRYEDIL